MSHHTPPTILVLPELTPALWQHLRAAEMELLQRNRMTQILERHTEPEDIAADILRFDTDTALENLVGNARCVIEWAYRLETASKRPRLRLRNALSDLMRGRQALDLKGLEPLTYFTSRTPLFVLRDAILAESNLSDRPRFKLIDQLTDLITRQ